MVVCVQTMFSAIYTISALDILHAISPGHFCVKLEGTSYIQGLRRKNVANVVDATSSEGFLLVKLFNDPPFYISPQRTPLSNSV